MSGASTSVTIVTQTTIRPESADAFARWQSDTHAVVATFPGFIEQQLIPPRPPLQVDWVILQRFSGLEQARAWLGSPERQARIEGATPMLVGRDDVHIVKDDASAARTSPVSAVISTRVKPGLEAAYLKWEQKIAAAQSKAPGMQGYRFEPAVPGVQEDYVAILRFDGEANLQTWMDSPERRALVAEAAPLTAEFHTRTVQSGFEQWFRTVAPAGGPAPAAWKMNMIVVLTLYPTVFLWGVLVGTPILSGMLKLDFPVALFIGNVFSVLLTAQMVPWTARRLGWWLSPAPGRRARANLQGAALLIAAYAIMILAFWKLS
ncbi:MULTISPECIES: antibiotic biosynthesis monooxygenase [Methylobacterium]|jgi:antibiotic biosynthesis monooxygenase (ABM) superfamily enzyme|uniref:antibiotic biosynthesis monooxygenase n=1 Tax=Methylobacterium TaxID=407 RepID=UPI0006AE8099|nr:MULTISPECIES: antibiotic biosynthesis monooxygenase [unclassified Methylobacterium]KOX48354.1 antibiotic biosynthesis monooxygenase [Streptomyces purpurogeneiscleroticus]MBP28379.1 antibiotic biosynthesis monooxygenase [Methylobacterium sp.]MDE4910690.1 antibiotic biosynthesis monooxygenase [Methylobacterium sp. 092160098-2]RUP14096.1 MAG: antibiotic biosynthesis monooxygenase [Methylobacterium sp.]